MRIILDTNVFVSAVFFGGIPGMILDAWKAGTISLAASPTILNEYRRVLVELSVRFNISDGMQILELLAVKAKLVPDSVLPERMCTDPDDDKFLACALAANAKIICSGDKALLKTTGYKGIRVITPGVLYREHLAG